LLELWLFIVNSVVLVVTLVVPDWIEVAFHVDPDGGSGSLEWLIVGFTATMTVLAGLSVARTRRRLRAL
jgi:hypothetical protein